MIKQITHKIPKRVDYLIVMFNKKSRRVYVLLFYYFFTSFAIIDAGAQTLSLNGNDWKLKDVPSDDNKMAFCNNWIPASVP